MKRGAFMYMLRAAISPDGNSKSACFAFVGCSLGVSASPVFAARQHGHHCYRSKDILFGFSMAKWPRAVIEHLHALAGKSHAEVTG